MSVSSKIRLRRLITPIPGTEVPVIYGVVCSRRSKTSFLYGVSGPSAARDFILAMLKNIGFYVVLGSGRGPGAEKLASYDRFNIDGPNMAPTSLPRWLNMGQHRPNIGRAQPALNIGPDCFHTGKECALCLPQFNIALPGFARRISAQSFHTISQKSLLGRRPAVRRKPLYCSTQ